MLVSAAAPSSLHRLPIAGVCLPLSPTSSRCRRCLLFPPLPGAVAWLHGLAWCCSPQWALLRHSRPPPRARAAYEHFLSLGTSRHPACRHGCARGGPHRGGEIEDERSEKGGGRPQRMERRVAWRRLARRRTGGGCRSTLRPAAGAARPCCASASRPPVQGGGDAGQRREPREGVRRLEVGMRAVLD